MITYTPIYAQREPQDAQEEEGLSTAYDSTWATAQIPEQPPVGSERFMLAQDKLYVVLAVVLVLWLGIAYFIFKTDRKLLALEEAIAERTQDESIPE